MGEQNNFILAIVLSMLVVFGYSYFFPQEVVPQVTAEQAAPDSDIPDAVEADGSSLAGSDGLDVDLPTVSSSTTIEEQLTVSSRVFIETPELVGSINLRGLLFDDLSMVNHKTSIDDDAENIRLFTPKGTVDAYYSRFGWTSVDRDSMPNDNTVWSADREVLTPSQPVTFSWTNPAGLVFATTISVDEQFMFTVEQGVTNGSGTDISLTPYGVIRRDGLPETSGMFILHEGLVGVMDGILNEATYGDMEDGNLAFDNSTGWLGITDKYWMTALIPDQSKPVRRANYIRSTSAKVNHQVNYIDQAIAVPAGTSAHQTSRMYAGAKIVKALDHYETKYNITDFHKAVDWGWFHFLTRPIFKGLDYLYGLTGNFGVAILLLTIVIKLIMFPIANKGYRSMSRMKKVGPKMKKLQERYKDDKQKLQQETMALYKKENVNPVMGCLPIFAQIPVFFALYKVLFVTIEMRHQPFFGWIQDLSARDPLTPFNLFGLLPFDPPSFIAIGIWPILMGLSMWLQQKLNPQSGDPTQQAVMKWLPVIFTFILGNFAAGLVIYWTWNNLLSIAQQWVIMRREGVSINEDVKDAK